MKNFFFICISVLIVLSGCNETKEEKQQEEDKPMDIIAYYCGDSVAFKKYPTEHLTHIIYSFLHLKGNKIAFDKPEDSITVARLVELKKSTYLQQKVLLSLGGWGGCETCSSVFSTDEGRKEFANSVKDMLAKTHTDGIDLDWEYPSIEGFKEHRYAPEDKHNFTLLLQTLRATLGDTSEISFAAGGYSEYLEKSIEWSAVMPLVNRVNLMSYDLVNGNSVATGHQTPLYSTPQQSESVDHGVRYLESVGVPPNKIVIGAAFYARVFQDIDSTHNGLYRFGKFKTEVAFKNLIDSLSPDQGFAYYWDSIAKAPYAYSASKKEFATFDNKESIGLKSQYVIDNKLGGIMFWELSQDRPKNGLLETIARVKNPIIDIKDVKEQQ